jgi:ubiquinone/menaquinone biosynthesis C-methylase UbiE
MVGMIGGEYVGRKAAGYDAKREKQQKWAAENALVESIIRRLKLNSRDRLLDVPVGTGRFLKVYDKYGVKWLGVDSSEDMLAEAGKKSKRGMLLPGDAASLADFDDKAFEAVVMVRLLHLVPWPVARRMLAEAARVCGRDLILTAQLGKARVGLNVATHDERAFRKFIGALRFEVIEEHRLTSAGWHLMHLRRMK